MGRMEYSTVQYGTWRMTGHVGQFGAIRGNSGQFRAISQAKIEKKGTTVLYSAVHSTQYNTVLALEQRHTLASFPSYNRDIFVCMNNVPFTFTAHRSCACSTVTFASHMKSRKRKKKEGELPAAALHAAQHRVSASASRMEQVTRRYIILHFCTTRSTPIATRALTSTAQMPPHALVPMSSDTYCARHPWHQPPTRPRLNCSLFSPL